MGEVTIGSIAEPRGLVGGPFGSDLVSSDYVCNGVPVIRGNNMSGRFVGGEFAFVTESKFAHGLARNAARPADLVFTQRGTLGQVSLVPDGPYDEYVVSQSQMRLRVDEKKADPNFVYYACRSRRFLQQVKDAAISTGVPHINLGILAGLRVPGSDLVEQRAIAEVLGALDDKIVANERVVAAADNQRIACMDEANRRGRPRPLSSLARFVNGRAFTKGATGSGRVVVRIAELNSGLGASTVYNSIEVADEHLARPGDLLFAWSGSLTVARWYRDEAIINQHIFKVVPNDGLSAWLVDHAVRTKLAGFKAVAADKATTMGHIQRRHLDEPVMVPSAEDIKRLSPAMSALWDRALAAEVDSLQLECTRDELLPLLMSGKLRVRDAEKVAEDVL